MSGTLPAMRSTPAVIGPRRKCLHDLSVAILAPMLALVPLACGTDSAAPTPTITPSTDVGGNIRLSTTPTAQWGDTASCAIPPGTATMGTSAGEGIAGVQAYPAASRDHTAGCLDYPMYPPVGGAHNGKWATCGFYSSPVPVVHAVHSMEHGAVWITFSPDLPAAQVKAIKAATDRSTFVLANPYPALGSPIVLSAWTRQLRVDSTSDPRFEAFISTYVQGPQTPELGASCASAAGRPG